MLECGSCGCALHDDVDDEFCDGDELECADCGATNMISCDEDYAYVGHWSCVHGNADDEPCLQCDDSERPPVVPAEPAWSPYP